MSSPCPICSGQLAGGELIRVCSPCKQRLGGTARWATGEFQVSPEVHDSCSSGPMPRSMDGCSWCGRPGDQVKKLLGTAEVAICNECVALCAEVLLAELGPDWR